MLPSVPLTLPSAAVRPTRIIVGLSGGTDSMVLLSVLEQSGHELIAAHCNFGLRGSESDRDEAFVREQIRLLWPKVKLEVLHTSAADYARDRHLSIEMAAREIRYDWFKTLLHKHQATLIAVGHHSDDQVETVLHNLIRGTGGEGLTGMSVLKGHLYRPLLHLTRREIEAYARRHGIPHLEDSTNSQVLFTRNKIRHQLIPLLEEINPSFRSSFLKSIDIFTQEQVALSSAVRSFVSERLDPSLQALDLSGLSRADGAAVLLYRFLHTLGFTAQQVDDLLSEPDRSGACFYSSKQPIAAELFRRRLYLFSTAESPPPLCLATTLSRSPDHSPHPLRVDAAKLPKEGTIKLSHWSKATRFRPYGLSGSKSVGDYLKERGVPLCHRAAVPILTKGEQPLAVPPFEIDGRYAVDRGTTEILYIHSSFTDTPAAYTIQSLLPRP